MVLFAMVWHHWLLCVSLCYYLLFLVIMCSSWLFCVVAWFRCVTLDNCLSLCAMLGYDWLCLVARDVLGYLLVSIGYYVLLLVSM